MRWAGPSRPDGVRAARAGMRRVLYGTCGASGARRRRATDPPTAEARHPPRYTRAGAERFSTGSARASVVGVRHEQNLRQLQPGGRGPHRRVAPRSREPGHDAWLDRDLTGGQRWWDHILQSIRDCDTFVVALSSASLESRACQSELQYATALGKPVLPVLVKRDVSDGLMPPALAELQRVDYTQADKAAFAALNRGLTTMPAAPPLPAELPPEPEVPQDACASESTASRSRV